MRRKCGRSGVGKGVKQTTDYFEIQFWDQMAYRGRCCECTRCKFTQCYWYLGRFSKWASWYFSTEVHTATNLLNSIYYIWICCYVDVLKQICTSHQCNFTASSKAIKMTSFMLLSLWIEQRHKSENIRYIIICKRFSIKPSAVGCLW